MKFTFIMVISMPPLGRVTWHLLPLLACAQAVVGLHENSWWCIDHNTPRCYNSLVLNPDSNNRPTNLTHISQTSACGSSDWRWRVKWVQSPIWVLGKCVLVVKKVTSLILFLTLQSSSNWNIYKFHSNFHLWNTWYFKYFRAPQEQISLQTVRQAEGELVQIQEREQAIKNLEVQSDIPHHVCLCWGWLTIRHI